MAFRFSSAAPLKRFYKYLLKRVIGSFLKRDIDLDQLEVQLWSGQVKLKNLELDVSSLNALPGLRCSAANLGCVKMLVPWRRLVSDHCKVYISGLHLVFTKTEHFKAPSPADDTNPPGFFEAPSGRGAAEESRYTEEGIETLSRLVKRILARMEVCLHDLSVTAHLKPCLLRGRLSSVVLLSEPEGPEEHMKRSLRVGVVSLSMLPESSESQDAEQHAGEVTFLSTRGQESVTAAAGVLDLVINSGIFLVSLQLPAIRLTFTAESCSLFAEALTNLSQALRRAAHMPVPDIEDLENNPSPTEPFEEDPPPPMVQSLLFQSAMATGPGHFWQDLYSLFQADDELASAAGEENMGAVEGENTAQDPEEEEAFQDVLEGEDAKGPIVKMSLKVQVGNVSMAMCFLPDQVPSLWSEDHPQPRLLPVASGPMASRSDHQGQLCVGGLSFNLDQKLEPSEEPSWNFSAESLAMHVHQYQDGEEVLEEEEEMQKESQSEKPGALASSHSPGEFRGAAASDMFRSAFSELPRSERPRTPSLDSEKCLTEESEGEESESFGHSSVHSLSAVTGEPEAEDDEGIESDEELHDAFFQPSIRHLLPRRRQDLSGKPVRMARGQWLRSSPHFLSKQVLDFVTDGHAGSSSSGRRPPSPAPGQEHPIWLTLGFQEGSARRLWVATVEENQARSLRFGCFPLQMNFCAATIKFLRSAVSSFRSDPPEGHEAEGADSDGRRPFGHEPSEGLGSLGPMGRAAPNAVPRLRFVAVAPAIRMVLQLSSSTSLVGDLVLPRLLAPNLPEEQDAYLEALRFDLASAMLYLSTPQEVTELLSLRPAGSAAGFVHRAALELVLLTRQAPSPVASSPKHEAPPEASPSPPLTGWTRLTALRPSAPPPGHLHLPPVAESKEPPLESSPSLGGGEFVRQRCPRELEMSVPGDVQFQVPISQLCHLKQQAQIFIQALRLNVPHEEFPRPLRPGAPAAPLLGFSASLSRLCLRLSEDPPEPSDSRSGVTAVQLCLTSCQCVLGSFAAEDIRLQCQDARVECLVQEGGSAPAAPAVPVQRHILLRPATSSPPGERQRERMAREGEVTLSSYLWQALPRHVHLTPSSPTLEASLKGETFNLQLRQLVFLCERSLFASQRRWLSQVQNMFKAEDIQEQKAAMPTESERSLTVRIQLMDCFLDLPSKSASKDGEGPTSNKEEPFRIDETWRMVLEVTSLEGRVQTKAPHRGSLRSGRLEAYVSDGAKALEQSPEVNLIGSGFVPFFEISSASCSSAKETEAELRLGRVHCHLRPDTARTLRRVCDELSTLLPAPQTVDMPDVVTQKAMPQNYDAFGEETFLAATSSRFDESDNDILANVDMFAFAPRPRAAEPPGASEAAPVAVDGSRALLSEAMTDALQNGGLHGDSDAPPCPPELLRGSSASSSSCRVDEFIRAQELQQSPRSPVCACAPFEPFEEGGAFEMHLEELPEAIDEEDETAEMPEGFESKPDGSEVVAVCLFDPEVVSEQHLQQLYDEEEVARQQVEQQFHQEERPPPTPSHQTCQVRNEQNSCVMIFDLDVEVIEDYFVRGELGNRRFEAPRWAPAPTRVFRLHLDELNLSVYEGNDFGPTAVSDKDSLATDRRSRSHLTVHLGTVEAKYMQFPATLPRGVGARKLVDSSTLRYRAVLSIRDFDIQDRVHQSVFSSLLASFEDEEKRPRPSMSDMLYLRVDELVHGTSDQPDAPKEVAPEYNVELQLLPLQLTVDQDTVEFLEDFWQMCSMSTYVEEPDQDYMAQAGIDGTEQEDRADADELQPDPLQALNFATEEPNAASGTPLFFQQVSVGSLLLSVDYKAKRLNMEALKRGELWELLNLLPLLEGLQVHFRNVTVYHARGYEKVLSEIVQCWSADVNRTQIIRSLAGITPIRSIANVAGGLKEMVIEPLKQYRAGEDAEHVSRTMLRGVISFLRHMTIESIDLTERVFLGAQAALEYANNCFTETEAVTASASSSSRRPSAIALDETSGASSSSSRAPGSEWLPVERGSAHFMQPGGAAEGLQEAGSNLTRGLRNTGPFLVKPLRQIKQGASKKQVLQSVATGIPVMILRPAIGVASAAVPAIRGVRNRLDPSHRREMVRKYRGPG